HTVEKIGGTSMSNYAAVRDNIILHGGDKEMYGRIFVVSAYGGITNLLRGHKQSGTPGVFALFPNGEQEADDWGLALEDVRGQMEAINASVFEDKAMLKKANAFIGERLDEAESCLSDLQRICQHGHFALQVGRIMEALKDLDPQREIPIVTGYAHTEAGL